MYASEETENLGIYIDESIYNRRVSIIAKPKVDFAVDVLKQWGEEPMSWLDIGCGGGELL